MGVAGQQPQAVWPNGASTFTPPSGSAGSNSGDHLQWLQALVFRPSDSSKFDGRPETFLPWVTFFETSIESTISNPTLRLKHLLESVSPAIQKQLNYCALLEPTLGYELAKSMLWADFGSPQLVCDSVLTGLEKGSLIQEEDLKAQRHLSREVSAAHAVLDALSQRSNGLHDYTSPANDKRVISCILAKVPYWSRSYTKRFPGYLGLNFTNLKDFLEEQTMTTSDPLLQSILEKAKSLGYRRTSTKTTTTPKPNRAFNTAVGGDGGSSDEDEDECFLCRGPIHSIFKCKEFIKMDEKTRFEKLFKVRCLNCGEKHPSKDCPDQRRCQDSNCPIFVNHSPKLHGGFRKWNQAQRTPQAGNNTSNDNNANNKRGNPNVNTGGNYRNYDGYTRGFGNDRSGRDDGRVTRASLTAVDQPESSNDNAYTTSHRAASHHRTAYLNIIPLIFEKPDGRRITTFGHLDPCADTHFVSDTLQKLLGLSGTRTQQRLTTALGRGVINTELVNAKVRNMNNRVVQADIEFQVVPASRLAAAATPEPAIDFDKEFPNYDGPANFEVDLPFVSVLVGVQPNTLHLHRVLESHESADGTLLLQRTPPGLAILGIADRTTTGDGTANLIRTFDDAALEEKKAWENQTRRSQHDPDPNENGDHRAFKTIQGSTIEPGNGYRLRPPKIFIHPRYLMAPLDTWLPPSNPIANQSTNTALMSTLGRTPVSAFSFEKQFFPRFPSTSKLKTAIAWLVRFCQYVRDCSKVNRGPLTADELAMAELAICRIIQQREFSKVFDHLKHGTPLHARHPLYKVGVKCDGGLLRTQGTDPPNADQQCPIIMPNDAHFTQQLISETHQRLHHGTAIQTANEISTRFWMPGVNHAVRTVLSRCIRCKRNQTLTPHHNAKPGDLVFLHQDNVPRKDWPLARIIEVLPSPTDGIAHTVRLKTPRGSIDIRSTKKTSFLE